ncbi:PAS domain-containing protein [Sphingomonas sp.]|uniref:PAS domain-containing protein n=1 Tax=Sphingomonas sp. TaxID=28214 RepID=UPI002ED97A44
MIDPPPSSDPAPAFLSGGGVMGAAMRGHDWSRSPLGAPQGWPQSLRAVVSLLLNSRFPMFLAWGEALGFLYNDAYMEILGGKHPAALGARFAEVWPEIWDDISPLIDAAMAGEASYYENLPLTMQRKGFEEQTWFTFSYSPVRDESGAVAGMFCACTETTDQVLAERRTTGERQRLAEMFQQAPGFMTLLEGPDHRFALANAAYMRLVGDRDVIGKTVAEALPEVVEQGYILLLDGVWRSGKAFSTAGARYAVQVVPGGPTDERYVDFVYQPITDAEGRVTGIFVEGTDITERKRAEMRRDAVVALEERFRVLDDPSDLSFASAELLGRALGAQRAGYGVIDAEGKAITVERDWQVPGSATVAGVHHFRNYGTYIEEILAGRAVMVEDVLTDPRTAGAGDSFAAIGVRAFLDVPVVEFGKTAALIFVHSATPRPWTEEEIDFVRDIAERTRAAVARRIAERELRDNERELQRLADNLPLLVSFVDRDECYAFNNKGYHDWFGRTPGELKGRSVREVIGDDAYALMKPQMARALSGERFATEQSIPYRDGGHRHVRADYVPRIADDGTVEGYYAILQDIADRKRAEDELRASEARLRDLNADLERQVIARARERGLTWQASPYLLSVLNADGRFEVTNPAWVKVLGWDELDLRGQSFSDLVHPDDMAATAARWDDVVHGQPVLSFENRYRGRDGAWHWLSWVAVPADGKVYCTARDVTEDRVREAELARAQDQLRQAQKMEAVGQLTGGIAHDFNNLLTVIRGSVELLMRPGLSEERRTRYIQAIADTSARATKLTGQLLAFSRRQALKPEVFDAVEAVCAIADMMGTLIGPQVTLEIDDPGVACCVNADPSQFDTALVNMAVNARDAMNGEGRLTITVAAVDGVPAIRSHPEIAGDFVSVALADTGSGIAIDTIDQIFEPFFTTKSVGQGTGLGLSQVFGFAKQSGGEVQVDSVPGNGAVFTLYLPRVAAPGPTGSDERSEATAPPPPPPTDGGGACVLVVEDNADVGAFATQTLHELGYETTFVPDAATALATLAAADEDAFDVVFSDVVMPGMSGIELGQEIRRLYPDLPVVLTSGYSHVLAQNGTYGFELLHKPYSIEELSRVLRTAAAWGARQPGV